MDFKNNGYPFRILKHGIATVFVIAIAYGVMMYFITDKQTIVASLHDYFITFKSTARHGTNIYDTGVILEENAKETPEQSMETSEEPGTNRLSTAKSSVVSGINQLSSAKTPEFSDMPEPCPPIQKSTQLEDIMCMERPKFLSNFKNPCWYDRGKLQCVSYFYLFGVGKSGTTDFFKRLLKHPEIVPIKGLFNKELFYWTWRARGRGKGTPFANYVSKFRPEIIENVTTANGFHPLITGHGDPMDSYTEFYWKRIPQNDPESLEPTWTTPYMVHHMTPNVKLFYMLRDPIERLFSYYIFKDMGKTASQFHKDVVSSVKHWNNCTSNYTVRHCLYDQELNLKVLKAPLYGSFYNMQLREWFKVFPRQQFFIFRNEDYSKNINGTLREVFKFLDIEIPPDEIFSKMVSQDRFRVTQGKEKLGILEETKKILIDLYQPHMKELAEMLNDERYLWKDVSFP